MSMSEISPERWSAEAAHAWYRKLPYLVGANFVPSSAINQLEMWQPETFDPSTIERELGWAAGLGMNVMRVYLHDLLWEHDAQGFCSRIDQYLKLSDGHGIRTLFVLFDDCWNPEFSLGPQPAPKPATHNAGWVQSPGKRVVNDPTAWPRLERYVTELLTRYRKDERILGWDLYNEPGNGALGDASTSAEKQGKGSLPLLREVFGWARSVPSLNQPLTCGPWNFTDGYQELNEFSLAASDILTFHNYGAPLDLSERIRSLKQHGRPLLCTEYMCRGLGSTFHHSLPILAKHDVGAIHWGLVAGKTNTIYPWGWNETKGVPDVWFHDVFNLDGSLLYPSEGQLISEITASARQAGARP